MQTNQIDTFSTIDERGPGRNINVAFNGKLREEQQAAFEALSSPMIPGFSRPPPPFGKTVIGCCADCGEESKRAHVLVHRSQLMETMEGTIGAIPLSSTKFYRLSPSAGGGRKKREIIGLYGANKDTRSGIIDIAMLQSMGRCRRDQTVDPGIRHGSSWMNATTSRLISFEQVLKSVTAKHIYGLTATPKAAGRPSSDSSHVSRRHPLSCGRKAAG